MVLIGVSIVAFLGVTMIVFRLQSLPSICPANSHKSDGGSRIELSGIWQLISGYSIAVALALTLGLMFSANPAQAASLTVEFEISPMIEGSRPWDGTGINSAQIDSEGKGMLGIGKSLLGQVGLDQLNQRMAPPDPVFCLILPTSDRLRCDLSAPGKDTLRHRVQLPADLVNHKWFGMVLVDSDDGNLFGGRSDLIGFGVVLDERTLDAVRAGNAASRRLAAKAERKVTELVAQRFGTNRSLLGELGGGKLNSAKMSASKCEYGCSMGEAVVTISVGTDGW